MEAELVGNGKGTTTRGRCYFHPISEANSLSPFGSLTPSEFYARHSVSHSASSFLNPKGLRIFTQTWSPLPPTPVVGTLCVVHGFTGESSWFVQLTAVSFASMGFATAALDLQGHGFSEGLCNHIPDINPVLDDCSHFFHSFLSQQQQRSSSSCPLPSFLYGESLGAAICLLLHLRHPETWGGGIVLNGALCGVSPAFKPMWPLEHLLNLLAALVPTWRVVPTKPIPDVSFKEEWKARLARASPRRSVDRPRAGTACEIMRVAGEVQSRFGEVSAPLLIVHGSEDVVCDPAGAKELYQKSPSKDKTMRMHEGMWHQLIGEPKENVDLVFGEMYEWLRVRAERAGSRGSGPPDPDKKATDADGRA
ncbi:Caffeoylshikimate esterase [Nymphaea thermarum]|nr:Caffeoylshikimate esterase [Nymphaea thermarum]